MAETLSCPPKLSVPEWPGCQSRKFQGGKFHSNHPADELDHLLVSQHESFKKPLGPEKKHFGAKMTIGTDEAPKPQIRPFEGRNKSTVCFGVEEIPRYALRDAG